MAAITAATPCGEPAVERHQIARAQPSAAIFAARSYPSDRSSLGQAPDDDTKKAAGKRSDEQRAPPCGAGAYHSVEQSRLDHPLLLLPGQCAVPRLLAGVWRLPILVGVFTLAKSALHGVQVDLSRSSTTRRKSSILVLPKPDGCSPIAV